MTTTLVPVNLDSIRVGHPLPFALMDAEGTLIAEKGFVIQSREDLNALASRGLSLFIDVAHSEDHRRAYVHKLYNLIGEDKALGQIAGAQMSSNDLAANRASTIEGQPDWLDLQVQANAVLRDTGSPNFLKRLDRLLSQLQQHAQSNPDGALFALFHLTSSEIKLYSATHAMHVTLMCGLTAREVLNWSAELELTLCRAALTMNIGMTDLQDRLALQTTPLTPEQRQQIDQHAARSAQMLTQLGINDPVWLEAVRNHHDVQPGALASKSPAQGMARLIQRADMLGARLAPRISRTPSTPAAAMQASYFDENRQVDEAGAALIKAVGIYSPGSFVRLNTNEVAAVIHRGANTTTPRVAVLINREGIPTVEPIIRDTSLREHRIVASVPHREVRIKLNLQRLLPLTAASASDRLW